MYTSANTVMISLGLPEQTKKDIRTNLIAMNPSKSAQEEMQEFLRSTSPSINFKIILFIYTRVLCKIALFKDNNDCIDYLIYKI